MAGFGFDVTFGPLSERLTRDLLNAVQRRARQLDLELRYRRIRQSGRMWLAFTVAVDGPLVRMESLLEQLELELPAFAEGAREREMPPRERVAVAWDLIEAYADGMREIREAIFDLHRRLAMSDYGAAPLSYVFDPGHATHLTGRLQDLTRTLGMFRAGYLPPEQVVEEVHTLTEALLREAVGSSGSFADKTQRAHAAGYLSQDMNEAFIELKDRRKRAKHQGQGIRPIVAAEMVNRSVRGLQALLLAIADRDRKQAANQTGSQ